MSSYYQPPSRVLYTLAATILLLLLLLVAALVQPAEGAAAPPPQAPPGPAGAGPGGQGEQLFAAKCAGCHTIGKGRLVGPDLAGVTQRRDLAWIKSFIGDPAGMLSSDPIAKQLLQENNGVKMPTLGLSAAEIGALVTYLQNPGGAAPSPAGAGAAMGAGVAATGTLIFTGGARLAGGGPACIACHTVQGTGSLGGGSLGPDLTHVAQRYGQPGLAAALQTIAFPTMAGPFANKALAAAEQADLVAFFVLADQQQAPVPVFSPGALTALTWLVLGLALAGAAALFIVLALFWPRQRQSIAVRLRKSGRSQRR